MTLKTFSVIFLGFFGSWENINTPSKRSRVSCFNTAVFSRVGLVNVLYSFTHLILELGLYLAHHGSLGANDVITFAPLGGPIQGENFSVAHTRKFVTANKDMQTEARINSCS